MVHYRTSQRDMRKNLQGLSAKSAEKEDKDARKTATQQKKDQDNVLLNYPVQHGIDSRQSAWVRIPKAAPRYGLPHAHPLNHDYMSAAEQ